MDTCRILGIDPGTLFMGYALLDVQGKKASIVDFGVLDVHKLDGQYARLQKNFSSCKTLLIDNIRLRSPLRHSSWIRTLRR